MTHIKIATINELYLPIWRLRKIPPRKIIVATPFQVDKNRCLFINE
jgi:hypothetical protein